MKKDIEQQLKDNLGKLDVENVPDEVWAGIREQWVPENKKDRLSFDLLWKIAAVILLTTSIVLLIRNNTLENRIEELATLGDISPKYKDIENSYLNEISQLTNNIPMNELMEDSDYSWMIEELKALEEINLQYRSDIGKAVDQDRLVDALIDYYEKKLRLLKKLELEIKRQQNEKEHATTTRTI